MEAGLKRFIMIVVVVVAILGTVIGLFYNQRVQTYTQYEKMCNDARSDIDRLVKDPKLSNLQKRTQVNQVIAERVAKIPRHEYICEVVVPGLEGP